MTKEKFVMLSRKTFMIPLKYCAGNSRLTPDTLVPACVVKWHVASGKIDMYWFGAYLNEDGTISQGFCQSAYVPEDELEQYAVNHNKHVVFQRRIK